MKQGGTWHTFQAKWTASVIAWRQGKLAFVSCWCEYGSEESLSMTGVLTTRLLQWKEMGKKAKYWFLKHLAKTTNWNAEKKILLLWTEKQRHKLTWGILCFCFCFFLVHLLPLSQWSWMFYSWLKRVKSNEIKKSREIVKYSRTLRSSWGNRLLKLQGQCNKEVEKSMKWRTKRNPLRKKSMQQGAGSLKRSVKLPNL